MKLFIGKDMVVFIDKNNLFLYCILLFVTKRFVLCMLLHLGLRLPSVRPLLATNLTPDCKKIHQKVFAYYLIIVITVRSGKRWEHNQCWNLFLLCWHINTVVYFLCYNVLAWLRNFVEHPRCCNLSSITCHSFSKSMSSEQDLRAQMYSPMGRCLTICVGWLLSACSIPLPDVGLWKIFCVLNCQDKR